MKIYTYQSDKIEKYRIENYLCNAQTKSLLVMDKNLYASIKSLIIAFLFLSLCSCNKTAKETHSKETDLFIYQETINEESYYIIEKFFVFDNLRYVKGFYVSDDSIRYRYSAKYRITSDTLFRCKSKDDDYGDPYIIKDDKEHNFDDSFLPIKTQYEGYTIKNGKKVFKFHIEEDAIDGKRESVYYDSDFITCLVESDEFSSPDLTRVLLDTIPQSLINIVDSIKTLQFNLK